MKKINRAVFAVLIVTAALGGCDFLVGPESPAGNGGGGNLSVSLGGVGNPGDPRAVTSGADLPPHVLAALRYELVLTGPGGEVLTRRASRGENILLTVSLGKWRIDARAYLEDALAGTGSQSFTVMPGDNSVLVPMEMNGGYFDITLDPSIPNGTVSPSFAAAFPGTKVTLAVTPGSDYTLKAGSLKYGYGGSNYTPDGSGPYTFAMPASDVTVSAEFIQLVRYVRVGGAGSKDGTSWTDASDDLQVMMDELASLRNAGYPGPFVVKLGAGTYKPEYKPNSDGTIDPATAANDRDSVFILREGVEIRGGYAAAGEGIDETTRKARFNPDGTVINAAYRAVLSGDFNGDDNWSTYSNLGENAYHVVLGVDIPAGSGTVLDGLTITGGYANAAGSITVDGYSISQRHGGGLYNHNSAPNLTNVVLSSSAAGESSVGGGGGMYNYLSSPMLTGVTISGNNSIDGGGMHNDASSPVLNHVVIIGNMNGTGGGMYNKSGSSPVLTNVTISGNSAGDGPSLGGGGMYNTGSSPVLTNVTISGNTANSKNGGGMYNENSSPVLTNVTISGNSSGYGGAMYNKNGSSPVLTNVTISGNKAGNKGGGMYNDASTPKIRNNIIWGNTASVGDNGIGNNSSTPVIAYSIVQESYVSGSWVSATGTDGGNNLDVATGLSNSPFVGWQDPGIVTMPNSGGDYHPKAGGPAINTGNNSLYPANADDTIFLPANLSTAAKAAINAALAKDSGGANRKNGPIDMGAYEKQ